MGGDCCKSDSDSDGESGNVPMILGGDLPKNIQAQRMRGSINVANSGTASPLPKKYIDANYEKFPNPFKVRRPSLECHPTGLIGIYNLGNTCFINTGKVNKYLYKTHSHTFIFIFLF